MKTKIISICGLNCAGCACYLVLQNDNDKLRKRIAQKWSEKYGWKDLKPEDINCLGCLSLKEPLFRHCKECRVRKCGLEKKITNCGECEEYDSCEKISSLHKMIPGGKKTCQTIRNRK